MLAGTEFKDALTWRMRVCPSRAGEWRDDGLAGHMQPTFVTLLLQLLPSHPLLALGVSVAASKSMWPFVMEIASCPYTSGSHDPLRPKLTRKYSAPSASFNLASNHQRNTCHEAVRE